MINIKRWRKSNNLFTGWKIKTPILVLTILILLAIAYLPFIHNVSSENNCLAENHSRVLIAEKLAPAHSPAVTKSPDESAKVEKDKTGDKTEDKTKDEKESMWKTVEHVVAHPIDTSWQMILTALDKIVNGIVDFFSLLTWPFMFLIRWAFTVNNFIDVPLVRNGWQITLGVVNVFFGLGLLVIAFSTVLRLDNYGMKKALPRLIIIALLINFSLTICGLIIDFSQVLTLYFLSPTGVNSHNFGSVIMHGLSMEKGVTWGNALKGKTNLSLIDIFIRLFSGSITTILASIVLAMAAFFLIVRIVYLWILIIVAPLAWFAWIFPETQSYCSDWWKSFLKWVTFAPAYAFFFYLACMAVQTKVVYNIGGMADTDKTISGKVTQVAGSVFGHTDLLFQYIVVIVLLLGGLIFAQKSGIYGADATMKAVNKSKDRAKGWAKGGALRVGRWTHRKAAAPVANKLAEKAGRIETERFNLRHPFKTAQVGKRLGREGLILGSGALAPSQYKKAYEGWRKSEENKIYPETEGSIYDAMKNTYSREESHHKNVALQNELSERMKEETTIPYDVNQRIADARRATKEKDWRGLSTKLLYFASMNDLNAWFKDEWDNNKELFKESGIKKYDDNSLAKYLNYTLDQSGANEEQKAQVLNRISDISFGKGNMAPVAWSKYENGKWRILNPDNPDDVKKHEEEVNNMVGTMAGRKLISDIRADSLIKRDENFAPAGLSSSGASLIVKNINNEWIQEYNHARGDTKEKLASGNVIRDLKDLANGKGLERILGKDLKEKNPELFEKTKKEIKEEIDKKSGLLKEFTAKVQGAVKGEEGAKDETVIDTNTSNQHFNDLKRNNYQGK